MALVLCQREAFARECTAEVLRCEPLDAAAGGGGDGARYAVELSDTVLFPEGGGQPSDTGLLNGAVRVLAVARARGGAVVHTTDAPVSGSVRVAVDWARRFDHMQQHSAQHLLSALAVQHLAAPTVSWGLLSSTCTIDLDAVLDEQQVARLGELANAAIREARPVRPRVYTRAEAQELSELRSRGIPEGVEEVRVIEIEGLDVNTCCGTHVANTAQLQLIKIVAREVKKRGTRITFLAGGRVEQYLDRALDLERSLNKALSCGMEKHADAVLRLADVGRQLRADKLALLKEVAALQARQLYAQGDVASALLCRPDAEPGALTQFGRVFFETFPSKLTLIADGQANAGVVLFGPEAAATRAWQQLRAEHGATGGGRKGQFQGMVPGFAAKQDAIAQLLRDAVHAGEQ